jgi:hypothetical protein
VRTPSKFSAGQDRHLLAGVQHVGCLTEILFIGNDLGRPESDTGKHRTMLAGRVLVLHVLEIVGQDQCRDARLVLLKGRNVSTGQAQGQA